MSAAKRKDDPTPKTETVATASMLDQFIAARRVSVPFLAIRTADQQATQAILIETQKTKLQQGNEEYPSVQWDAARGLTGANRAGEKALADNGIKADATLAFVEAMIAAAKLPKLTILFVHNANRQLQSLEPAMTAASVQALSNLRDDYKRNFRMVVLLACALVLPEELKNDVVVLDHALPGPEELAEIVRDLHKAGELPKPSDETVTRAVDAVSGLSTFLAEQRTAMSLTEAGLDIPALWEGKRVSIEQTPGLSVHRGTMRFDDLRGLESVKTRLRSHLAARTPVGTVVWIDEGSDAFANVDTDTSGNKTDQQRTLLMEMEKNGWRGAIFIGVPGAAKSALASSFGNEAGVPTISIDFGAMESKWQGESEAQLRHAVQVIKAVGRGNAFFILTANSLRGIRPQLQRRFKRGIFFFDLPTAEQRADIWALYLKKFGFDAKTPRPDDDGWTGAEIKECVESAWDTNTTIADASRFIIPVARSRGPEIEAMRREAHGRFLDANNFGQYQYKSKTMERQLRGIAVAVTPADKKAMN